MVRHLDGQGAQARPGQLRQAGRAQGGDPANPVDGAKVLVEPSVPMQFNYAVVRPWKPHADTIAYNQGLMIDRLAMALINRRLAVRARPGQLPVRLGRPAELCPLGRYHAGFDHAAG
jgi:zinc protease